MVSQSWQAKSAGPDVEPFSGAATGLPSAAPPGGSLAAARRDFGATRYLREEPYEGKPHVRICEGEAEWLSHSTNALLRICRETNESGVVSWGVSDWIEPRQ